MTRQTLRAAVRRAVLAGAASRRAWLVLVVVGAALAAAGPVGGGWDDSKADAKGKPAGGSDTKAPSKAKAKKASASKFTPDKNGVIRWGRRPKESAEDYDKRYAALLKRVKQDKEGDTSGGPSRLWTVKSGPFIVRSDISAAFTADTAMYMEMLHRDYSEAYSKILGGVTSNIKEPIEVVVFSQRKTYLENGGSEGSGGFFMQTHPKFKDRGQNWPVRHYRLQMFTRGEENFAKWHKGTLKHEAAHMELQMRLGLFVDTPRWFNEGHATVFEYWDFDQSVDENLADVANRGRYAPVIRRVHKTDKWKDFHYVWTIDAASWHGAMTDDQGMLNYAQAWSLAAYMMGGGKAGWRDFRKIFDLSKRVGADQKNSRGVGSRSWELAFPDNERKQLEQNWEAWVATNVARDKRVPDEETMLLQAGYNPLIVDTLEGLTKEHAADPEFQSIRDKYLEQEARRKRDDWVEK